MPSPAFGWNSFLSVGKESTWGTAVARTESFEHVGVKGGALNPYIEKESFRTLSARNHYRGLNKVLGTLMGPLNYQGFETLFQDLFGSTGAANPAITTPGGGTLSRQLVFTFQDAVNPGLSFEYGLKGVQGYIWAGGKITDVVIDAKLDKIMLATFGICAKAETKLASGSLSAEVYPAELPITWDQIVLKLNGTAVDFTDLQIKIDNGLDHDRRAMGSLFGKEPQPGKKKREVTVNLTSDFEDSSWHDLLTGDTTAKLNLVATGALIEGAIPYSMNWEIPVVFVATSAHDADKIGIIPQKLIFRAVYDVANSAEMVKCTIVNKRTAVP